MIDNASFRKEKLKIRNEMSKNEVAKLSESLVNQGIEWIATNLPEDAKKIMCYYPLGNEADIRKIYFWLLSQDKELYFPVSKDKRTMDFFRVRDLNDLTPGRFGVMEPREDFDNELLHNVAEEYGNWEKCKIVCFTPGTVFDRTGNRMGFGKGYYDRYFNRIWREAPNIQCLRVGVAYEFQLVDRINRQPWDVPMDVIFTDKMIYDKICADNN